MVNFKNKAELHIIISAIKRVNESRNGRSTISTDQSNEELINILHDVQNEYSLDFDDSEYSLDFDDSEISLTETFGYDGYCVIREAEQGIYQNYQTSLLNKAELTRLFKQHNNLVIDCYRCSFDNFCDWVGQHGNFDENYIEIPKNQTCSGHAEILDW